MATHMIEHWGMVKRVDHGCATVVVETTGCTACGHGGHCAMHRRSGGGLAATVDLPAGESIKEGDFVTVGLPESRLTFAAVLGYLFPALAALIGAWLGYSLRPSDAGIALGAGGGFIASLVIARLAIAFTPGLSPKPQLLSPSPTLPLE
jgi:sigma-E factor negative regulatory protein RseC